VALTHRPFPKPPTLQIFAERLAAYLEEKKDAVALKDLCGSMWVHRSRFKFRKAFIAPNAAAMAQQLAAFAKTGNVQPSGEGRKMQVAYVFTGQGSQYPGVGKSLMVFPVYKDAVEAADKIFKVRPRVCFAWDADVDGQTG
jgi:acyl transferase domain-containing protein